MRHMPAMNSHSTRSAQLVFAVSLLATIFLPISRGWAASRSVRCVFSNQTPFALSLVSAGHDSGKFSDSFGPPVTISPKQVVEWRSESDGFATGAIGSVRYSVTVRFGGDQPREEFIDISWDNPFVGNNAAGISSKGAKGQLQSDIVAVSAINKVGEFPNISQFRDGFGSALNSGIDTFLFAPYLIANANWYDDTVAFYGVKMFDDAGSSGKMNVPPVILKPSLQPTKMVPVVNGKAKEWSGTWSDTGDENSASVVVRIPNGVSAKLPKGMSAKAKRALPVAKKSSAVQPVVVSESGAFAPTLGPSVVEKSEVTRWAGPVDVRVALTEKTPTGYVGTNEAHRVSAPSVDGAIGRPLVTTAPIEGASVSQPRRSAAVVRGDTKAFAVKRISDAVDAIMFSSQMGLYRYQEVASSGQVLGPRLRYYRSNDSGTTVRDLILRPIFLPPN